MVVDGDDDHVCMRYSNTREKTWPTDVELPLPPRTSAENVRLTKRTTTKAGKISAKSENMHDSKSSASGEYKILKTDKSGNKNTQK